MKELIEIQNSLKVKKGRKNTFGNYNYRSCEDIMEAVKPLLEKYNCSLTLSDEIVLIGDRFYVKSRAWIKNHESKTEGDSYGYARESEIKKGMDSAQITGAASSYARKYALCGLFLIDDSNDLDSIDNRPEPKKQAKKVDNRSPIQKIEDFFFELPNSKKPGLLIETWEKRISEKAPELLQDFKLRADEFLANQQQQGK